MSVSKIDISQGDVSSLFVKVTREQVLDYVKVKHAGDAVGRFRDYLSGIPDARGVDLSDLDLRGADFSSTLFCNANLSNTRFDGCLLVGANFMGANVLGTSFSKAGMVACSLQGCDARKTNFTGADMRWSNLMWTDVQGNLTIAEANANYTITVDDYAYARTGTGALGIKPKDIPAFIQSVEKDVYRMPMKALSCFDDALQQLLTNGVQYDLKISKSVSGRLHKSFADLQVMKAQHPFSDNKITSLRGLLQFVSQGVNSKEENTGDTITVPMEIAQHIGSFILGISIAPDLQKRMLDYALDRNTLSRTGRFDQKTFVDRVIEGKPSIMGVSH